MDARMRPDPRPRRRVVTIDLDACLGPAPLLEEEQDFNPPIAESEEHDALSIPTNLSSPLFRIETLVRNLSCGDGTATEQY